VIVINLKKSIAVTRMGDGRAIQKQPHFHPVAQRHIQIAQITHNLEVLAVLTVAVEYLIPVLRVTSQALATKWECILLICI
jgi:hypothetical protein